LRFHLAFESVHVDGEIDADVRDKLVEIADKCPVHKTLTAGAAVVTRVAEA